MRGELGYEEFGKGIYKVWKRFDKSRPNVYCLIGFVRRIDNPFGKYAWEAWTLHNKLISTRVSRNEAALSIPHPVEVA